MHQINADRSLAEPRVGGTTLNIAIDQIGADNVAGQGGEILRLLQRPFAVYNGDHTRMLALLRASSALDHGKPGPNFLHTVETLEPNIPWTFAFLRMRSACYASFGSRARAAAAESDLVDYLMAEPGGLEGATLPKAQAPPRVARG